MEKRLYKSATDKKVSGVLSGMAKHFQIDVSLVRISYLILLIFTGFFPFLILYFLMDWVLPEEPKTDDLPAVSLDKEKK